MPVRLGQPKKGAVVARIKDGLIGGGIGGLGAGLGGAIGGPVGVIIGGALAGALLDPDTGKIVAVNAAMDAVASMLIRPE